MSSNSQRHLGRVLAGLPGTIVVLCAFATLAAAQDRPAPKWELFGGYSFFHPGADVHGVLPEGLLPVSSRLEANPRGAGVSLTYNFNRWLGWTADISGNLNSGESGVADRIDDTAFYNLSMGPKLTFRSHRFSPFLEALAGDHRLSPDAFHPINKLGFMFGGGLDVNVARHVALRLIRADYVLSSYRYGPSATTPSTDIRGVRLQAGIVLMWGGGEQPVMQPMAACSVRPSEVMVGEPVTVNASASQFNPKHPLTYQWSSSSGRLTGTDSSASIDTTGLSGGSYTATVLVADPKAHKNNEASCSASFLVKEPPKNPPSVSCSASPSSVQTGTSATIRCSCTSPDNAAVSVGGWSASRGSVSGSGSTAVLNTSGTSAGPITVSASCSDSRGLNAEATTEVRVENPPAPSPEFLRLEARLALHSVYFATAKPSEEKPDAGLLPSQEKTLTALAADFRIYLQEKPQARLTLEGHADPRGSREYNQALSERRVGRTRRFLIEQGVPAANLETKAFGDQENLSEAQVKAAVERNPELSVADRQRVLTHMRTILLASNRRVDITLNNPGQASQESVRQYPFNAADSLTLLKEERTGKAAQPAPKKKARAKAKK